MTEPEPSARDEQVRRLLADARHDEPMPADVAARLDAVLADLGAERSSAAVPPPVDLAARRRRRQGAALLVAAAAVVAIGVGVGTMVDRGSDDSGGGDSAAQSSEGNYDRAEPAPSSPGAGAAPSKAVPPSSQDLLTAMPPVRVSSTTFADDAERYRPLGSSRSESDGATSFPCRGDFGAGVLLPALYDGAEAVLAYRPPTDDAQVVDLLRCGSGDVVRTTTLPVP